MIETKKLEKYIQLLKKHSLHEMELESEDGVKIRLTATAPYSSGPASFAPPYPAFSGGEKPGPAGEPVKVDPPKSQNQVRSPFVGTFYEAAGPDSEPFVRAGQRVKKGDTLCIIEAMKIMNEIEAERDCTIREILVGNSQAVEYDQVLFVID